MNVVEKELKRIQDGTDVDWSDERAAQIARAMKRRARNRVVARRAAEALAVVLVLVGAGAAYVRFHAGRAAAIASAHPSPSAAATTAPVAATTGPSISPESDDFAVETTPSGLSMRGRGVFTAGHAPVVVRCGEVTITGSDASFEVERDGERARVSVRTGHVVVAWAVERADVAAGETETFPKASSEAPKHETATRWRSLARAGSYDSAYVELEKSGPASVRDEPGDLFLAADVARLSNHSADAEAPLERLIERHPSDARAPLAAFTLGRVRLEELGHPREAAAAFGKARELAPSGPLAEDALARQVESLSRAGDSGAAHDLALEYLRAYPSGRRTIAVKKFGGVD